MSDELRDAIQKSLTQGLSDTQAIAVTRAVETLSLSAERQGEVVSTHGGMDDETAKKVAILAVATACANNAKNIESVRDHLSAQDDHLERQDEHMTRQDEALQGMSRWIADVNHIWKLACVILPILGTLLWWLIGGALEFHRDLNLDRLRNIIREEINSPAHLDKMKEAREERHQRQQSQLAGQSTAWLNVVPRDADAEDSWRMEDIWHQEPWTPREREDSESGTIIAINYLTPHCVPYQRKP